MIFLIEHGNKVTNLNTPENIKKVQMERKDDVKQKHKKRKGKKYKKRKGKKHKKRKRNTKNEDKTTFYYENKIIDDAFILTSRSTCTDDR